MKIYTGIRELTINEYKLRNYLLNYYINIVILLSEMYIIRLMIVILTD